jgi:PPM family protein phosphatase
VTTIFQKLLGRQKPTADNGEATTPISSNAAVPAPETFPQNEALDWTFGAAQSVGRRRSHNEDALFTFGAQLSYADRQAFLGLFIVADGMGGHVNGELASSLAVQVMSQRVVSGVFSSFISGQVLPGDDVVSQLMLDSLQEANLAVKKQVPGGGTTLTALLTLNNKLYLTHVGDTRAYLFGSDLPHQILTRDHSLVKQLVELGQLSDEEAAIHPQRNILSMAVGQWEPLEPDFNLLPLPARGYILICSDGLWGVLSENQITQIIHTNREPRAVCQGLIDAANQAGGPDNISAVLIRIPDRVG